MNLRDYIAQKFQSFGINLSEADLLDVVIASGIAEDAEIGKGNIHAVSVGIARFIPELMIRATSISENGFSMSWDLKGIKQYYSYLCRTYGLVDKLNSDTPKITFLQ